MARRQKDRRKQMKNRDLSGVAIPPAELTPCGHLTDTPEKFYLSACADADRLASDLDLQSKRILDIGCGVGRLPIGLLARGAPFSYYLGIDVSRERIAWCSENLSKRDSRLHFHHIDMKNERYNPAGCEPLNLPIPPASIDLVNLYSVFSHLQAPDIRSYLDLIAEVLRPGGACFLTMFVADGVPPVTENPPDFTPLQWYGPLHCMRYEISYWRAMVEVAGLVIVRQIPDINVDGQTGFYLRKPMESPQEPKKKTSVPRAPGVPTCLVGFFGLNRSLEWTYDSIRRNILEQIEAFGCEPVLAAHFNCPELVHSPRSGEVQVPFVSKGLDKLGLELAWLEPQNAENFGDLLATVLQTPIMGEQDPDGIIRVNAMHQLHSLRRLGSLLDMMHPRSFDVYCLLRADLMYIDPMPVFEIFSLIREGRADIVTANWHEWGGYNDRFAFCSRRGAAAYLNRIDWVRQFCVENGFFHSESLLRYMAERADLKHAYTSMRAKRVRATGLIKEEDFIAELPVDFASTWAQSLKPAETPVPNIQGSIGRSEITYQPVDTASMPRRVLNAFKSIGIDLWPLLRRGRNAILRPVREEIATYQMKSEQVRPNEVRRVGPDDRPLAYRRGPEQDIDGTEDVAVLRGPQGVDGDWYRKTYPDIGPDADPVEHYACVGWREGRSPNASFSSAWYLQNYPDIAEAKLDPLVHYLRHGRSEGRLAVSHDAAMVVDRAWYLKRYPELARDIDASAHYELSGWREGKDPNAQFSTSWYLSNNPDIAVAGINPFRHYLEHGRAEGRLPKPRLLQAVRLAEWWIKLSPLFATLYATAFLLNVSILSLWPVLLLSLAAIAPCAAYVAVINDLTDRDEDKASAKRNRLLGQPPAMIGLLLACCIAPGFVVAVHWRHDPLLLILYLGAWAAFSLYSIPPVRLKGRGIFGVIADACGAHVFPTLLLVALVYRWQGAAIDLVWFVATAVWSGCYGLRGILWHQVIDRDNDNKAGVRSFVQRNNMGLVRSLAHLVVFPLELAALAVMIGMIGSTVVVAVLVLYLIVQWLRTPIARQVAVIVVPANGFVRPDTDYRLFLFRYYEALLPLSILLASCLHHPADLFGAGAHALLFLVFPSRRASKFLIEPEAGFAVPNSRSPGRLHT